MKNKELLTILLFISLFAITSAAIADGLAPVQNQQSYPVPNLYPIGQSPAPNYNPQPYNYQPQPQQPTYQQPAYQQHQPAPQPQAAPQQPIDIGIDDNPSDDLPF